jgi:hypothetical protein
MSSSLGSFGFAVRPESLFVLVARQLLAAIFPISGGWETELPRFEPSTSSGVSTTTTTAFYKILIRIILDPWTRSSAGGSRSTAGTAGDWLHFIITLLLWMEK